MRFVFDLVLGLFFAHIYGPKCSLRNAHVLAVVYLVLLHQSAAWCNQYTNELVNHFCDNNREVAYQ